MASQVSQEIRRELDSTGAVLVETWGGPQKQRYYTPAGDEVWAIPSMREWVQRDAHGKVLRSGLRDANLDKGWLLSLPQVLKRHCSGCDQWHDTEAEVKACVKARNSATRQWERRARGMREKEMGVKAPQDGEFRVLYARLDKLEAVLEKLVKEREAT